MVNQQYRLRVDWVGYIPEWITVRVDSVTYGIGFRQTVAHTTVVDVQLDSFHWYYAIWYKYYKVGDKLDFNADDLLFP